MKRSLLFFVILTAVTSLAPAQETHRHMHERSEKLGQVNFRISCSPHAQMQFNRAVAWLHSFEYEEAEKAFTEVTVDNFYFDIYASGEYSRILEKAWEE